MQWYLLLLLLLSEKKTGKSDKPRTVPQTLTDPNRVFTPINVNYVPARFPPIHLRPIKPIIDISRLRSLSISPEPIYINPIRPEPVVYTSPINPEPVYANPINPEPMVYANPIKPDPVVYANPINPEPTVYANPTDWSPAEMNDAIISEDGLNILIRPTVSNAVTIIDPPNNVISQSRWRFKLPPQVLVGFWFGWLPRLALEDIPAEYNVVCVAFLEPDETGIPHFIPPMDEERFITGISWLKNSGQTVLLSLGGAHEGVAVWEADRQKFKDEIMRDIDRYGFMGIDIDLEGASITAADNVRVIPSVLAELKDYYNELNMPFFITLAPEFNNLRGENAPYKPILQALEGYYDLVFAQYYNQGLDGIWSDEYMLYLSQSDNDLKSEFLFTLTTAIVTGTSNYYRIPSQKFAIGLPASQVSAMNGYVQDPADVGLALDRLEMEGRRIRGLMTWSINQDAQNGFEFISRYATMVYR
jgi:chitinase